LNEPAGLGQLGSSIQIYNGDRVVGSDDYRRGGKEVSAETAVVQTTRFSILEKRSSADIRMPMAWMTDQDLKNLRPTPKFLQRVTELKRWAPLDSCAFDNFRQLCRQTPYRT